MYEYIKTANGFKCPHCEYEKTLQSTVHMHIKAKHSTDSNFKCSSCEYQTSTKGALENHISNKHPDESNKISIKEHTCPQCVYECKTEGQLRSHYILKHLKCEFEGLFLKTSESISCSECKKEFKSRASFVYHCVHCFPETIKQSELHKKGLCL
jgi:hypothetical protein